MLGKRRVGAPAPDEGWISDRNIKRVRQVGNIAQTARRALKLAQTVRDIVNTEKKTWIDTPLAAVTQTSTATIANLNAIAQGDDDSERLGKTIKCLSFQMKGTAYFNVSATRSVLRIIVFRDNGFDGATPVITNLLSGTPYINAMRAIDPNDIARYTVLYDDVFDFCASKPIVNFEHYKKYDQHIKFDGVAAADTANGGLWILAISDEATNGPSVTVRTKIRYVDN